MKVHYLEIVTSDVERTCALYEEIHGLSFGPAKKELGNSRVAHQADGSLVGIRAPLAAHESPIVRTYVEVPNIEKAVKVAEGRGVVIAYPPTQQGDWGTFAIVIDAGVEHGLWQK